MDMRNTWRFVLCGFGVVELLVLRVLLRQIFYAFLESSLMSFVCSL